MKEQLFQSWSSRSHEVEKRILLYKNSQENKSGHLYLNKNDAN